VLVSIPIIVWGSQLVIKLMDRYPIIITLGGMLLGWIAGTMMVTDPAMIDPETLPWMPKIEPSAVWRYGAGVAGALLVLAVGKWVAARRAAAAAARPQAAGVAQAQAGRLRRMLLAVDGSEGAMHATRQIIDMRQDLADPAGLDLQLLHVQRPVSGDVSSFIASKTLDEYYKEQAEAALAPARAALDEAGVRYTAQSRVGNPAELIARTAADLGSELIVMGTRGQGMAGAMLGSVAQATVAESRLPVLLVR
jgi:nucleotide-binding universal stress UspA family protein